MRYAIVSDIHANRQAWRAVLSDIVRQDADLILCLGDAIGYGPSPVEVLDSVMQQCKCLLIGNHEAVIGGRCDIDIFNEKAQRIVEWTAAQLGPAAARGFRDLPSDASADSFLASHAEILEPERFNYIETEEDALENFHARPFEILFVGHTHISGVHTLETATGRLELVPAEDFSLRRGRRYIVNSGSVGDSRDDDPRASYCIFDEDRQSVVFRKVDFDVAAYKRDLQRSGVGFKPFFLTFFEHVTAHTEKPAADWRVEVSNGPAAGQPVPAAPAGAAPAPVAAEASGWPAQDAAGSPKSDRFQNVDLEHVPADQSWHAGGGDAHRQADEAAATRPPATPGGADKGKRPKFVIKRSTGKLAP